MKSPSCIFFSLIISICVTVETGFLFYIQNYVYLRWVGTYIKTVFLYVVVYVSRNMLVFTQSTWELLYSMSIVYIIFYTYVWWYWYMFCVDIPGSNAPPLWVGMRFLFVLILWWTVGYDTIYILNTVAPTLLFFYVALHAAKNEPLTDIYCIE